jgi:hypothetical protein
MWGLFIHFLSDVLTSLIVLGVGLAYHFVPDNHWYVSQFDDLKYNHSTHCTN